MDQSTSGHRFSGVDRRPGIVSGKNFSNGQTYMAGPHSPDLRPVPPRGESVNHGSSAAKPWDFGDPDMRRRKRIAKYKVYTVEGIRVGAVVPRWLNSAPVVPEMTWQGRNRSGN
ncbi:hypothetical protein CK203_052018 [Vitis vinifera]|uniref:Uncharacterized protein n=1 Tax=Vitis vinifera TaxID=29760 RepID=A0A438FJ02_VITVI|nr:hypothetical protein CK203_083443 [Vitis vinifera]RVW64801.1 hypothetical protein CK203_052018 [Vitis vinifera]